MDTFRKWDDLVFAFLYQIVDFINGFFAFTMRKLAISTSWAVTSGMVIGILSSGAPLWNMIWPALLFAIMFLTSTRPYIARNSVVGRFRRMYVGFMCLTYFSAGLYRQEWGTVAFAIVYYLWVYMTSSGDDKGRRAKVYEFKKSVFEMPVAA